MEGPRGNWVQKMQGRGGREVGEEGGGAGGRRVAEAFNKGMFGQPLG